MANYYCMIAGLPDIDLQDAKPGMSIEDMREQCEEVLTPSDRKLLFYFFLHFDCINLVKLLKDPEAHIGQMGNFTIDQFRDLITSATELNFNVHRYPSFMSVFAREYNFNKDKAGYFPEDEMAFQFFDYAIRTCPNRMMRRWYKLNLDITNILTAMMWLDECTFFEPFSMEAVFAYLCKLEMQQRWAKLDPEKGKETFRRIIDNLRSEARVPEEFKAPGLAQRGGTK